MKHLILVVLIAAALIALGANAIWSSATKAPPSHASDGAAVSGIGAAPIGTLEEIGPKPARTGRAITQESPGADDHRADANAGPGGDPHSFTTAGFINLKPLKLEAILTNTALRGDAELTVSDRARLEELVTTLNSEFDRLEAARRKHELARVAQRVESGDCQVLRPGEPTPAFIPGTSHTTHTTREGSFLVVIYPGEYLPLDAAYHDLQQWTYYAQEELALFFASL